MAAPSDVTLVRSARRSACPAAGCTGVHSYTADDTRWCWPGATQGREAIDVELLVAPPARLLARMGSDEDFWRAWTRLEVTAKLADVPVLTLLGQGLLGGPPPDGVEVEYVEGYDGVVVCLGRKP